MVPLKKFNFDTIYDLKLDNKYRIDYKRMIGKDKISCLNDNMFKTMFVVRNI